MKLSVLILGYGEMGHALEYLLSDKHDVRIWSRSSTSNLTEEAAKAQLILFCLPVSSHVEVLQKIVPYLSKDSLTLSIAKGLDESGKTAAQIFSAVLTDQHHFGILYGPMISEEIRKDRYAFADVALSVRSDFDRIHTLFMGSKLICKQVNDMTGNSWSVILKNVYAIMFGVADGLKLGDNFRGHLAVTALAEISAILSMLGANEHSPYGYAGLGDLITTATSADSHHHELGRKLALGQFDNMSGEGVYTLAMIAKHKIFESQPYPLFMLVSDIITTPQKLDHLIEAYLAKLQSW